MTTRGKIIIGIAGVVALINLVALMTGWSPVIPASGSMLGSIFLALWVIALALRIEQERDRALSAERTVKYLRERIKIMDGKP